MSWSQPTVEVFTARELVTSKEGHGSGQSVLGCTSASLKTLLKFCLPHFYLFPNLQEVLSILQHCHICQKSSNLFIRVLYGRTLQHNRSPKQYLSDSGVAKAASVFRHLCEALLHGAKLKLALPMVLIYATFPNSFCDILTSVFVGGMSDQS